MRIIIVEDDLPLALGFVELARADGCEVVAIAATESEALAAVEAHKPDFLLTDAQLAGLSDGTRIAATAWSNWGVPSLMLCQAVDASILARTVECGVAGYIPRPLGTAMRGLTLIEAQNALSGGRCQVLPAPSATLGAFLASPTRPPVPSERKTVQFAPRGRRAAGGAS